MNELGSGRCASVAPEAPERMVMSASDHAVLPERGYELAVAITSLILVLLRLACAARAPLSSDESLYWLWSRHLAGGYYDHPPANPLLIRLGTTLFGDTEFGVRSVGVLLGLPATWAVWRSAAILFNDNK